MTDRARLDKSLSTRCLPDSVRLNPNAESNTRVIVSTRFGLMENIMKSPLLVTSLAIASAVFSISAGADTGRPSCLQTQRSDASPAEQVEPAGRQPGSYAKYLMLNGVQREAAIRAAWTVDHPNVDQGTAADFAVAKSTPAADQRR